MISGGNRYPLYLILFIRVRLPGHRDAAARSAVTMPSWMNVASGDPGPDAPGAAGVSRIRVARVIVEKGEICVFSDFERAQNGVRAAAHRGAACYARQPALKAGVAGARRP